MAKFGDRFCESLDDHRSRWSRYRSHLRASGFAPSEPLIRHFANEVFHDRPVYQATDDRKDTVVLVMVNSFALNEVAKRRRAAGLSSELDPTAFETRVEFLGVSDCDLAALGRLNEPLYHQAELYRDGECTAIRIDLVDEMAFESVPETISLTFASACIEDIRPGVSHFLPESDAAGDFVLPSDPAI